MQELVLRHHTAKYLDLLMSMRHHPDRAMRLCAASDQNASNLVLQWCWAVVACRLAVLAYAVGQKGLANCSEGQDAPEEHDS